MPKVKEGFRQLATQVPADVLGALESLAVANRRGLVDEVTHAFRRHLAAPPTVRVLVEEPPLPPAEVEPPTKKPRRRPRKPSANGTPQES